MGSRKYICKIVIVSFSVFLWKAKDLHAEKVHLDTDVDFSEGLNKNYFFYQQSEYPRDCQGVLHGCSSTKGSGVYVIKPDGYPEPFEVYCENDVSSGGWTVLQRRTDGSIKFNRLWEDYKTGFGFLSREFSLGNEKLSYITNQADYDLRVDIQLTNGSSFSLTYSNFRISDEWDMYAVVTLGEHRLYGDAVIASCPYNMVYTNCKCHATCEEPSRYSDCCKDCDVGMEGCSCPEGFLMNGDDCVPASECPCFWTEIDRVIPNNVTEVNIDCTERRTCSRNQLVRDSEYRCGSNAQCLVQGGVRQCYCTDGFIGDGQTCEALYTDCFDAYNAGQSQDGVYLIKPTNWPGSAFNVSCVMTTNGGGWTVFQRRTGINRQMNFQRNWTSYRDGFGSFDGDFWLGNEKLHYLTSQKRYKLRVDIVGPSTSTKYHAEYTTFNTGTEPENYRVRATGYSGNIGYDAFIYNNGNPFSTYDRDNDGCGGLNCAERHSGGWWYSTSHCSDPSTFGYHCVHYIVGSSYDRCTGTDLNGDYNGGNGQTIFWDNSGSANAADRCGISVAEMKIRPMN